VEKKSAIPKTQYLGGVTSKMKEKMEMVGTATRSTRNKKNKAGVRLPKDTRRTRHATERKKGYVEDVARKVGRKENCPRSAWYVPQSMKGSINLRVRWKSKEK